MQLAIAIAIIMGMYKTTATQLASGSELQKR